MEKRKFLTRVVLARVGLLNHDSNLFQSVTRGNGTVEWKLPDKLAAIQPDNKLAWNGDPDDANDETRR